MPARVAIVFIARSDSDLLIQELRDIGLIEGRDIIIERRSTDGEAKHLAAVMQELVSLNVDVIVTGGPAAGAAQRATDRIPIVALVDDALETGLIDSLGRPRRNVTGFGGNFPGLHGKELQLLKEAVPTVSRVAMIAKARRPGPPAAWRVEFDTAASQLRLDLLWLAVDTPEQFEPAFETIARERAHAVFVTNMDVNFGHLGRIADLAAMHRLPSFCAAREFAEAGGLISYGYGIRDDYRHAAAYVKKIIDGAKPADLPWEQPTKLELVINLKTAKALGLVIPQTVLRRADEVID
jgi:putative ABC transport system substrate-binding protein